MDRPAQLLAEVQILGTLCNREIAGGDRAELMRALEHYVFLEPEHRVLFESIRSLLPHDRISPERLAVHLNNRGFPDVDLAKYSSAALADIGGALKLSRQLCSSERGFSRLGAALGVTCVVLVVLICLFAVSLRRYIRESLMQSVTSAHYQILCPSGTLSQQTMIQFAEQRESFFARLDRKLNDAASNAEIKAILDPDFRATDAIAGTAQSYEVTGTTIRTKLSGALPQLDSAADAEALLYAAWGKPGSPRIAHWTAVWLVGEWQGEELGMAAATVEQRVGHKKVESLLSQPAGGVLSPQDRALLGAAWINAIAELGGPAEVQKLYSARMTKLDVAEVTKALGTTSTELERKWQMWMYAYIAGMPPANHTMTMPMDMHMSTNH
jgi:hypothetical protein